MTKEAIEALACHVELHTTAEAKGQKLLYHQIAFILHATLQLVLSTSPAQTPSSLVASSNSRISCFLHVPLLRLCTDLTTDRFSF